MSGQKEMKVLMIGPARSVHGGVSAVVNNYYAAGLDQQIKLKYIATMVDGSKVRKLIQAMLAYITFLFALPSYHILHVNMAADASCYRKKIFIDTAWLFRKKIIIHEHGGDFEGFYYERCSEKQRANIKRSLNRAKIFLVLSESWKKFFSEIVDEDKIHVLQNGIVIPTKVKQDYSSHKVLFLGRLCKEKGIGELLEAVPVIQKQIQDFKLILGGVWEEGNEALKEKARALSETVLCPGWISEKEREALFQECSIFVLPTWFEGQPISLLEAMAAGMCVAASAVGGIPQIMGKESDVTGILLPQKDANTLADELIKLLKDEEQRRKMGQNARIRIINNYDVNRNVEALVGFYKEIGDY
ncbi:MAG: glycosyltransferase family 4 protein [Lachnospiraceae bacterium]|nr:glycosyltransferase family 4 protein [Lachnospiraceae bacterium]